MRRDRATIISVATFTGALALAVTLTLIFGWGIDILGLIIMGLAVIPTTLFLARYLRVAWWNTIEGRHMVGMAAVIDALLIEQMVIQIIPGPQTWHWPFVTVLLAAIAMLMWQRYLMLIYAQRDLRQERERQRTAAQVRKALEEDDA